MAVKSFLNGYVFGNGLGHVFQGLLCSPTEVFANSEMLLDVPFLGEFLSVSCEDCRSTLFCSDVLLSECYLVASGARNVVGTPLACLSC